MLTSFSQLSAELVGRRYGSGVLKHEPREAEKINILLPDVRPTTIETAFDRIDKSQRSGDRGEATWLADALIFEAAGIQNWAKVSERLNKTLLEVRARRRPQSRIIKR